MRDFLKPTKYFINYKQILMAETEILISFNIMVGHENVQLSWLCPKQISQWRQ